VPQALQSSGTCSLTVSEIARLAEVDQPTTIRAITMAIAGGLIERDGGDLFNRHIHYKLG
jgi:DNA-binding MarR family transcriptional regulator